jgi:hypothetical protein
MTDYHGRSATALASRRKAHFDFASIARPDRFVRAFLAHLEVARVFATQSDGSNDERGLSLVRDANPSLVATGSDLLLAKLELGRLRADRRL